MLYCLIFPFWDYIVPIMDYIGSLTGLYRPFKRPDGINRRCGLSGSGIWPGVIRGGGIGDGASEIQLILYAQTRDYTAI